MSRFFPHPPYAEDQPLGRTILTTHVLTRGATTGTLVALAVLAGRRTVGWLRSAPVPAPSAAHVLRSAGTGALWGVGFLGLALVGRMWGREDIEWRDRSWRLLENQGQLETDDWTYGGAVVGLVGAAVGARRGGAAAAAAAASLTGRELLGAAGVGTAVGTVGYMAWRYGVHRGKFPAKQ